MKRRYLDALKKEIQSRADGESEMETLYFGGGTPSFLELEELGEIVGSLEQYFRFAPGAERTLEVNPEDLTPGKVAGWKQLGFNRLSIGIQTFSEVLLKTINRAHTPEEVKTGIQRAVDAGFENISVDLIMGLPGETEKELISDLQAISSLPIKHISVYLLSIDSQTVFEKLSARGELSLPGEEEYVRFFSLATQMLCEAGFEHYEISNFALPGWHSRHNTSYWQQKPYLGFGPGAHSYTGDLRQWNIAHLPRYCEAWENNGCAFEWEELSPTDKYNEYILTTLRTQWGADFRHLQEHYAPQWQQTRAGWERHLRQGHLIRSEDHIRIKASAWLIADAIIRDLFIA